MLFRQAAGLFLLLADEVGEECSELVAGEGGPGALAILGERRGAAHPVAIGVGGENDVGCRLLSPLDGGVEDGWILGVGDMSRHVREIAARLAVRSEDFDLLEPISGQGGTDGRFTHAVQGREDDLEVPRARERLAGNRFREGGVHFLLAEDNLPFFHRGLKVCLLDLRRAHHPVHNRLVVRRHHLRAARPVDFHGVVARRVVAGGDHDAAGALFEADQERQLGRAAVVVQEIDLEAVRHHDGGAQLREVPRIVPCVVSDGTSETFGWQLLLEDIRRQPLRALPNRPVVDHVAADGVHLAAAASGAEGNDGPEGVVELFPFAGGDVLGHLDGIFAVPRLGEPGLDVRRRRRSDVLRGYGKVELHQRGGRVEMAGHGWSVSKTKTARNGWHAHGSAWAWGVAL
jgi:hypothetical protein